MSHSAHRNDAELVAAGKRALATEIRGLQELDHRIDASFAAACRVCLDCQ